MPHSILQKIYEQKREEVLAAEEALPACELEALIHDAPPPRGFTAAINRVSGTALIAEIKKASPSQGLIRADFNPVAIAKEYERSGAHCLSVLTDVPNFQGSPEYLRECREATSLPCLRKDFIFDEYQILESRAWGADAILLIVAMLEVSQLKALHQTAKEIGLDVLVEVHDEREANVALDIGADLIGVNNRDLNDFKTDLKTSLKLLPMLKDQCTAVSESALDSAESVRLVTEAGAKSVLIGTAFCASPDIRAKVEEIMGWHK